MARALVWGVIAVAFYQFAASPVLMNIFRPSDTASARPWFEARRSDFAEAVRLASSGAIPGVTTEYYGGSLPGYLASLSVDGKISSVGACNGEPVLFLPQWEGIPDDAIGFVHLPCETVPTDPSWFLDLYGDPLRPVAELGDGWWWTDGSKGHGPAVIPWP